MSVIFSWLAHHFIFYYYFTTFITIITLFSLMLVSFLVTLIQNTPRFLVFVSAHVSIGLMLYRCCIQSAAQSQTNHWSQIDFMKVIKSFSFPSNLTGTLQRRVLGNPQGLDEQYSEKKKHALLMGRLRSRRLAVDFIATAK